MWRERTRLRLCGFRSTERERKKQLLRRWYGCVSRCAALENIPLCQQPLPAGRRSSKTLANRRRSSDCTSELSSLSVPFGLIQMKWFRKDLEQENNYLWKLQITRFCGVLSQSLREVLRLMSSTLVLCNIRTVVWSGSRQRLFQSVSKLYWWSEETSLRGPEMLLSQFLGFLFPSFTRTWTPRVSFFYSNYFSCRDSKCLFSSSDVKRCNGNNRLFFHWADKLREIKFIVIFWGQNHDVSVQLLQTDVIDN